jgi:hypothetical protein
LEKYIEEGLFAAVDAAAEFLERKDYFFERMGT